MHAKLNVFLKICHNSETAVEVIEIIVLFDLSITKKQQLRIVYSGLKVYDQKIRFGGERGRRYQYNKNRSSGFVDKKVQVGNDQEKAQSEKDSHFKNRGGKKQTN